MARKLLAALASGKIPAHAGGQSGAFDQPRHLLIVQRLGSHRPALTGDEAEEGGHARYGPASVRSAGQQPGRWRRTSRDQFRPRASRSCPATCQHAHVWKEFNPAATVVGLITRNTRPRSRGLGRDVEADDLWIWRRRIKRLTPAAGRAHGRLNPRACEAAPRIGSVPSLKVAQHCHIFCTRNMTLNMVG